MAAASLSTRPPRRCLLFPIHRTRSIPIHDDPTHGHPTHGNSVHGMKTEHVPARIDGHCTVAEPAGSDFGFSSLPPA